MSYEKIKAFNLRKDEASSAPCRPVFKSRLALELCSQDKLSWGAGPVVVGISSRGCVWVGMGRAGGALPSTSRAHTHTQSSSLSPRDAPSVWGPAWSRRRAWAERGSCRQRKRTHTSTQTLIYIFNFPKDYVFILKDVVSCFLT